MKHEFDKEDPPTFEDVKTESSDLMDRGRRQKQAFSKEEKMKYARDMHLEALCQPPKDPSRFPAFLSDPSLLPKKPPGRK